LTCLQNYTWPGNVRELQNVIERAAVLSQNSPIEPRHLPQEMQASTQPVATSSDAPDFASLELVPAVDALEARMIAAALKKSGDNKSKAARLLDISERSLWYKLKKLNLE
jgi:two-component system response regulator AtoC